MKDPSYPKYLLSTLYFTPSRHLHIPTGDATQPLEDTRRVDPADAKGSPPAA